jgi:hypothetical protein
VKPQPKDEGGIDERFWEIIMSADRKDYERICLEFGVKDLRLILKKLEQKMDMDEKMKKMGDMQLSAVSDTKKRKTILEQVGYWT